MVARQHRDQWLLDQELEREAGRPILSPKKRHIDGPAQQSPGQFGRGLARNCHLDVGQFVPQDSQRVR